MKYLVEIYIDSMFGLINYRVILLNGLNNTSKSICQTAPNTFLQPASRLWSEAKQKILLFQRSIKNSPNYHGRLGERGDDLRQRIKEQNHQPEKPIVDRVNDEYNSLKGSKKNKRAREG